MFLTESQNISPDDAKINPARKQNNPTKNPWIFSSPNGKNGIDAKLTKFE